MQFSFANIDCLIPQMSFLIFELQHFSSANQGQPLVLYK